MDFVVTKRVLAALENPPDATFHIDILTRLGNACAFADLKVERIALDELTVSVVTPSTASGIAACAATA